MAITASEARKNLFTLMEQVNDDRAPVHPRTLVGCSTRRRHSIAVTARGTNWTASEVGLRAAGVGGLPILAGHRPGHGQADQPHRRRAARSAGRNRQTGTTEILGPGRPVSADYRRARLVYRVSGDDLMVLQARYHYIR